MHNIAIFASGTGTNAETIINYFKDHKDIRIKLVVCNNPKGGVLDVAKENHVPVVLISKEEFQREEVLLKELEVYNINFVVLAGFLWLIPEYLLNKFSGKIINIHPALLPKYGGKGMYGNHIHEAVKAAGEKETGITVHYVNERYDEGEVIAQIKCQLNPEDTPETIKKKVQQLEYAHYPKIIEQVLSVNHIEGISP